MYKHVYVFAVVNPTPVLLIPCKNHMYIFLLLLFVFQPIKFNVGFL